MRLKKTFLLLLLPLAAMLLILLFSVPNTTASAEGNGDGTAGATGSVEMTDRTEMVDITGTVDITETADITGTEDTGEVIEVTGRVRLVGTSLFPSLLVSTEECEWEIGREDWDLLFDLQHRIVTVRGRETFQDRYFAGGLFAGRHFSLSDVVLVRVE